MTWFLIGVGGVVTSHGVGMAVPDWPNTYGYNMFYFPFSQWVGGIFWEHSHRLVASLVGFMTLMLAIWSQGQGGRRLLRFFFFPAGLLISLLVFFFVRENVGQHLSITLGFSLFVLGVSFAWPRMGAAPVSVRRLAWAALGLVVCQGMLGGLRVTLYADQIGIFHASTAQLFLVLISVIALIVSPLWANQKPSQLLNSGSSSDQAAQRVKASWFSWAMLVLSLVVFMQLILGATMRHQHAGLAVSGFPLAYDRFLWPPTDQDFINQINSERIDHREFEPITALHVQVHMVHRATAVLLLLGAAVLTAWVVRRYGWRHAHAMQSLFFLGLISTQAALGIATVLSNKAADLATLHVMIGALTLVSGSLIFLNVRRELHLANASSRVRSKAILPAKLKPEWSSASA
jgi:cytochrome c oxidase assembly protein subunit 15